MPTQPYLEPTQDSGRAFFTRGISGSVVMLNLLWFRATADYAAAPHLAPAAPITGEAAYRLYMEHTLPHLLRSGGKLLFFGRGGHFLIGPPDVFGIGCERQERGGIVLLDEHGRVPSAGPAASPAPIDSGRRAS